MSPLYRARESVHAGSGSLDLIELAKVFKSVYRKDRKARSMAVVTREVSRQGTAR